MTPAGIAKFRLAATTKAPDPAADNKSRKLLERQIAARGGRPLIRING
jgi:hypothetical protein